MLFHVNTILADFYWCFHVRDVQIAQLKHKIVTLIGATLILANKITITTFSLGRILASEIRDKFHC